MRGKLITQSPFSERLREYRGGFFLVYSAESSFGRLRGYLKAFLLRPFRACSSFARFDGLRPSLRYYAATRLISM